jgi:DNA-binding transcriptional ArsR family regulator
MLTTFFSSSARVKLLGLLTLNPGQRYYLRQLAGALHLPIRAIQRETERLMQAGLLRKFIDGNRVYFQIKPEYFLYPEIKRMFLKMLGARALLGEALTPPPTIQAAFVYGAFASDETTDEGGVDVFVVGEVAVRQLKAALAKFQEDTRRELNVYVTSAAELRDALSRKDGFIYRVWNSPKVFIVGDERELQRITA